MAAAVRGAPLSAELGQPGTTAYATGPDWATAMAEHLDWIARHRVHDPHPTQPAGRSLPFERVLARFVDRAALSLLIDPDLLAPSAVVQLERWLLERLVRLSAAVLDLELRAFRAARGTELDHVLARSAELDRSGGDDFAAHLLGGALHALVHEYPTWARLMVEAMSSWRAAVDEFVARLSTDRSLIAERLCASARLGAVTQLLCGVSDPHDGGRSVIMLQFAGGDVVVYKPRDLAPEAAFATVVRWLADREAPLGPQPLAVVERNGYGWMELARAKSSRSRDEVAEFYRRAGALLCLAYVLCATDCHYENIVASGTRPALVDAETLLHTVPHGARHPTDAVRQARAVLNDSVFATAMLPVWRLLADGHGYDNSGLGVADRQLVGRGPDREIKVLANVPRLDGKPVAADDHVPDIVHGFTAMYRAVLAHRTRLTAPGGPLERFRAAQVRILLRPTQLYGDLIAGALRPEALRDGAHYWRALRPAVADRGAENTPARLAVADQTVLLAELEALEHLDIPRFTVFADRPVVASPPRLAGQPTGTEPGLARVLGRLGAMGEADLRRQVSFIRGAFHCRAASRPDAAVGRIQPRRPPDGPVASPAAIGSTVIAPATAVRLAKAIATRMHDLAIRGADGTVTWIVPAVEHDGRYLLRPMGLDLYGGTAGVGLFLAALSRVTDDAAHRALALAAVGGLAQLADQTAASAFPVGGLTGLGSAIYALVCVADLLDRPDLLDTAARIAGTLDQDAVDRDTAYDLTSGSAGAALALLALARATGREEAVRGARRCADHLVSAATGTPASWAGPHGRLTGCAHGAAGIAHALCRVAQVTGERRYADAAAERDGVRERAVRPRGRQLARLAPGRPAGVVHARLVHRRARYRAGSPVRDRLVPQASADVAIAARATVAAGPGRRDHVCCGNLGRAAFLVAAAQQRQDPDLAATAASVVRFVVDHAESSGDFALVNDAQAQADHLGFFQGIAGIGLPPAPRSPTRTGSRRRLLIE